MGKTRDLFKKTRDTKGTFHAKMGTIKDINGRDSTEVEDLKKKWQEYTKNYTKNILMTQINTIMWSFTQSQAYWSVKSRRFQEALFKTIPKKKKYIKAKWLSEEALQIAMKRREVKGKGEKERYAHLNEKLPKNSKER